MQIRKMTELSLFRGDTFQYILNVYNGDGTRKSIDGATVFFTAKKSIKDTDTASTSIYKTITSHSTTTVGYTVITLSSTDTDVLKGTYAFDIQIKFSNGTVCTPLYGTMEVLEDVTRRTA